MFEDYFQQQFFILKKKKCLIIKNYLNNGFKEYILIFLYCFLKFVLENNYINI